MRHKIGRITALVAFMVMVCGLSAQIGTYYWFNPNTTIYQNTVGILLTDAMVDDGISYPVLLNFPFPYGLNTYNDFIVSSNGWLNLGSSLTDSYYSNDLATLNIRPVLAPLWDDLGMNNGAVQYYQYGSAPHRYCVVQWSAANWNYQASNEFNFQARLHETGQIDFIYGTHSGSPGSTASASIGINMVPGGPGNYFSVYPGFPAHVSSTNQMQSIVTPITENTMFTFVPKNTVSADASILNLYGPSAPRAGTPAIYNITVGNTGVDGFGVNNINVNLMRGNTVLATRTLSSTLPGIFINETIPWTPDSLGIQQIYAQIDFPADMDSTNNMSIPLNISVLPPVPNDDNSQINKPLLLKLAPNPVRNNSSTIEFSLKQPAAIELSVYDLKGRKVRTLLQKEQPSGLHQLTWNTTSDEGNRLVNGIYFIRLSAPAGSVTQKLMVLNAE